MYANFHFVPLQLEFARVDKATYKLLSETGRYQALKELASLREIDLTLPVKDWDLEIFTPAQYLVRFPRSEIELKCPFLKVSTLRPSLLIKALCSRGAQHTDSPSQNT